MKRILTFISILPFLSACVQEQIENVNPGQMESGNETSVFTFEAQIISPEDLPKQDASAKTVLGEKDGKSYPNYWAAGDAISVNGVASEALSTTSEYVGTSKARFEVKSSVDAPYYFAYPASAVSGYLYFPWLATSGYINHRCHHHPSYLRAQY